MVKFIDLETGYVFNGENPYVFWLKNGQSVGMIYSYNIGVLSDKSELTISMQANDIFSLINPTKLKIEEIVNGFKYYDLNELKCQSYKSVGTLHNDQYIHIIYFAVCSKDAGEFITQFKIDDGLINQYNIGADFYEENEPLYINLSNFGVELPSPIQKTIYESNVHEDKKDNILLNRKFKELLVNYWDVIANRGSYKSLINSIKWFEWGDQLKLREIWKKDDGIKIVYDDRELSSLMSDKYKDTLANYSKTSYYALFTQNQTIVPGEYDLENNPKLIETEYKWPLIDISIKMSLLGYFFETYFMPVHLNLIKSTIEDITFTNTFKVIKGTFGSRFDNIYDFKSVKCSVKNGAEFVLGNVSCQVNNSTQLGSIWNGEGEYDDMNIIGVDGVVDYVSDDNEAKTFYSQMYSGIGVMVPIELSFPLDSKDFIKSQQITFIHDKKNDWKTFTQYRIYKATRDGRVHVNFNLLCTKAKEYDLRIRMDSASGEVVTKRVVFNVIDKFEPTLKLFKITPIENPSFDLLSTNGPLLSHLLMNNQIDNIPMYSQYIVGEPYSKVKIKYSSGPTDIHKGVRLNHLIVATKNNAQIDFYLNEYYNKLDINKKVPVGELVDINGEVLRRREDTTIYISKDYVGDIDLVEKTKRLGIKCIQNKYIFIPQFHTLSQFGGDSLEDYTITKETLCCIPDMKFDKAIERWTWCFENASTGERIEMPHIQEPIIAGHEKELSNGFYNILFRYELVDGEIHEIKLNSAFVKK